MRTIQFTDIVAEWEKVARDELKGRTIVNVFYLNKQETREIGWHRSGLVLVLDNGAQVIARQDDEGNGPGALEVSTAESSVVLPTI